MIPVHKSPLPSNRILLGIPPVSDENHQNARIQQAVNRYNGISTTLWKPSNLFKCNLFKSRLFKSANNETYSTLKNAQSPVTAENRYDCAGSFPKVLLNSPQGSEKRFTRSDHTLATSDVLPVSRYLENSSEKYLDLSPTRAVLDVLQDFSRKRIHCKEDEDEHVKRRCRGLAGDISQDGLVLYKPLFVSPSKASMVRKDQTTQTTVDSTNTLEESSEMKSSQEYEKPRKLPRKTNAILASLSSSVGGPWLKRKRDLPQTESINTSKKAKVSTSKDAAKKPLPVYERRPMANLNHSPSKSDDRLKNIYFDLEYSPTLKKTVLETLRSNPSNSNTPTIGKLSHEIGTELKASSIDTFATTLGQNKSLNESVETSTAVMVSSSKTPLWNKEEAKVSSPQFILPASTLPLSTGTTNTVLPNFSQSTSTVGSANKVTSSLTHPPQQVVVIEDKPKVSEMLPIAKNDDVVNVTTSPSANKATSFLVSTPSAFSNQALQASEGSNSLKPNQTTTTTNAPSQQFSNCLPTSPATSTTHSNDIKSGNLKDNVPPLNVLNQSLSQPNTPKTSFSVTPQPTNLVSSPNIVTGNSSFENSSTLAKEQSNSNSGLFTFGHSTANSQSLLPSPSFSFSSTKVEEKTNQVATPTTVPFSFGVKNDSPVASSFNVDGKEPSSKNLSNLSSTFSFGKQAPEIIKPTIDFGIGGNLKHAGLSFGADTNCNKVESHEKSTVVPTANAFSSVFSTLKETSEPKEKPHSLENNNKAGSTGFTFGNVQENSVSSPTPLFSFGRAQGNANNSNSDSNKSSSFALNTNTPSFSFGGGQKPSTSVAFNFGSGQPTSSKTLDQVQTSSPSLFGPTKPVTVSSFGPSQTSTKSAFELAQSSSTTSTEQAKSSTTVFGQVQTSTTAFGLQPASTTAAFGQLEKSTGFGSAPTTTTSAFGLAQSPSTTSFGQVPATKTVFGKQENSTLSSVFGKPLQSTGATTFGQPLTSSTTAFSQSQITTFGQPVTSAPSTTFGSQPTSTTSPFGQPQNTGTTASFSLQKPTDSISFGQTQTLGAPPAFGMPQQTTFGTPQSSAFGQQPNSGIDSKFSFGAKTTTSSAFGQQQNNEPTKPTFAFGGNQQSSSVVTSNSSFTFGNSVPEKKASNSTFTFGSGSQAATAFGNGQSQSISSSTSKFTPINQPQNASSFGFGSSQINAPGGSTTSPFSFGSVKVAESQTSSPFKFGSNQQNPAPTSGFGFATNTNSTSSPAPSFNFGSAASNPEVKPAGSVFSFGSPSPSPSAPAFKFGSNDAANNQNTGFSFGNSQAGFSFGQPNQSVSAASPAIPPSTPTTPLGFAVPGTFSIGSGSTQSRTSRSALRRRRP